MCSHIHRLLLLTLLIQIVSYYLLFFFFLSFFQVDFVMEILSRLINKQVPFWYSLTIKFLLLDIILVIWDFLQIWKYPKLWVGFLKCAIQMKPQSFTVLLQVCLLHLLQYFSNLLQSCAMPCETIGWARLFITITYIHICTSLHIHTYHGSTPHASHFWTLWYSKAISKIHGCRNNLGGITSDADGFEILVQLSKEVIHIFCRPDALELLRFRHQHMVCRLHCEHASYHGYLAGSKLSLGFLHFLAQHYHHGWSATLSRVLVESSFLRCLFESSYFSCNFPTVVSTLAKRASTQTCP